MGHDLQANKEGYDILRATWKLFWNHDANNFLNKNKSEGSYDESGKYTVWPLSVACQAIVDAARIYPEEIKPMLGPAFSVLDKYYSAKHQAYCASEFFDGNEDIYYDDNAQVASALITAYEVTGDSQYLEKGTKNVEFLMTGYDASGKPGGVRWHYGKKGSNACTTAECALAALRLAKHVKKDTKPYIEFAANCCHWLFDKLQDPEDKLICDGLEPCDDEQTEYKRNGTKWTYNQGTPMSLCCMLYSFTKDEVYKGKAEELAAAVTNRETAIFDRDTQNMEARHYRDSVYFYQLLAEGFADFMLYLGDKSPQDLVEKVKTETHHTLEYVYKYLRDPKDGLYFSTFELYKINEHTYEAFKHLTGENKEYQPTGGEREQRDDIPVEKRPHTKSLISCAAAARIFFQSARLFPTIPIQ